jgi:hypothetical protein
VNWIHLAQDRVQWQALVKAVMKSRITKMARKFLTSSLTVIDKESASLS